MRFVVDEYPSYQSDCFFYEYGYEESTCKVTGEVCPNTYERPENCALVSIEDLRKEEKEK